MESFFFTFLKPFLDYIDEGHFFRKPFNWIYTGIAILNLILPIALLFGIIKKINEFGIGVYLPTSVIIILILSWIIIAISGWINFQIWWTRKSTVLEITQEGDDFVAMPVVSHFIQTLGESLGIWIAIVGFGVSLIVSIILGNEVGELSRLLGIDSFLSISIYMIILAPIKGFLIIVISRFIAESIRALATIANKS